MKITVELSTSTLIDIEAMATMKGCTATDLLLQAIENQKYFMTAQLQGKVVCISADSTFKSVKPIVIS